MSKDAVKKDMGYVLKRNVPTHLVGRTISQVIDSDTDGSNIMALLNYRNGGDSSKRNSANIPYSYYSFDDEVNCALDLFIYANSSLQPKFNPMFSKGQLKLKLKEIERNQKVAKQQAEKQARIDAMTAAERFRDGENEKLERYMAEARQKLLRDQHYDGNWGSW